MESEVGPVIVIADTHLGLLANQRFYGVRTNSRSDVLGLAGFVDWLEELETRVVAVSRGEWGDPLLVRKPTHLILLGDYLELWDASDAAIEVSSRGPWNLMERLTCEKIYVVGNHDFSSAEIEGRFPQGASSIQILPDTYPERKNGKTEWLRIGKTSYLLLHGHQFDWIFRRLGGAWALLSYFRDGAEAFRLWSWVLVAAAVGFLFLSWFSTFFLSLAVALFLAGALPRITLAFARPAWNRFFAPRYRPTNALTGFVEWWKGFISEGQIPQGELCVVYGHTHLMDIFNPSEVEKATGTELREQLTLINIPSWVLDIREEYEKIFRDVALYIDSNGFHLLGWDWRKLQPFYIPTNVAKRLATGVSLDEQVAQSLATIGWPEKLLAKLKEPPKILAQNYPISRPVISALDFIDSLKFDETRSDYFEVAEQDHTEHIVYNQSQYLLSVMFKLLGKESLAQSIRRKHDPDEPDNDPKRKGHKARDRFCVLEGDIRQFYLAGQVDAENSDEIALLALYWLNMRDPILGNRLHRSKADRLWKKLRARYDPTRGVLDMDTADRDVAQSQGFRELYPVYKVALLGILAKNMEDMQTLDSVREKLRIWQHSGGGWETDRTADSKPIGVANLETTALAILALAD